MYISSGSVLLLGANARVAAVDIGGLEEALAIEPNIPGRSVWGSAGSAELGQTRVQSAAV